jgi:diguanylate cyclase (GGDEF)-like protein/PAS domain S-box-containing protein
MFEQTAPRWLRLALALTLFAAITAARFAVHNPADATGILFVIPIALIAADFGWRPAFVAAGFATLMTAVWAITQDIPVSAWGYGARMTAFGAVAVTFALVVAQRERAGREATHWFSMANDLLCTVSLDGRYTAVNASWTKLLGYSREEIIGRSFTEFVHPDDLDRTAQTGAALAHPGELVEFENRYRAKDGTWRWLLWSARSDRRGIYATAKDVTTRKAEEAEREHLFETVKRLALTDELTGLANRGAWRTRLTAAMERSADSFEPLTVVLLDLDNFKPYNDGHGHQAGDRLLKACAASWKEAVRGLDVLGRLGGDEFALLLPACDAECTRLVVDRVRASTPVETTCSIGIATWDRDESEDELLERADEALYAAKRGGRDRVLTAGGH